MVICNKVYKGCVDMSISVHIQTILNGTITSLKSILPVPIEVKPPVVTSEPFEQEAMGVLIGIVGDLRGRVIIDGLPTTFSAIAEKMFGMAIDGEMLESFTGEFGNMIVGNLCTFVGQQNMTLDITPPTVMVGKTKLYGFQKAFSLPATIEGAGNITILLTIDDDE